MLGLSVGSTGSQMAIRNRMTRTKTMKPVKIVLLAAILGVLTAAVPGRAEDFTGLFMGSYLTNWTTVTNDNPSAIVSSGAKIDSAGLTITGAKSASLNPFNPPSSIEITHVVVGTGPTKISFSSLFYEENVAHLGDSAGLLRNGVVIQDLTLDSMVRTYSFTMDPGDTFGFRLTSDNDSTADFLQITQVPEPAVAALMLIGGLLLAFTRFSRRAGSPAAQPCVQTRA